MKAARALVVAIPFALVSVAATGAFAKSSGKTEYLKSAASPPAQTKARVTSPRDPATGQATGKRSHKPIR